MTDTRDDFEKWACLSSRQAWRHKGGTYVFCDIQAKWEGWQARAQAQVPAIRAFLDVLDASPGPTVQINKDAPCIKALRDAVSPRSKSINA